LKRKQLIGAIIFVGALEGIIAYGIMLYYFPLPALQVAVFIVIALILGVTAWIGYTLIMAPPPKPPEEEEKEETEEAGRERKKGGEK